MWISQRVHQFIALEATGLTVDYLLVEGKPRPNLESGRPAMIVYADNLNVLATNPSRVQATKKIVVEKLRALGFEACTVAQSFGFQNRWSKWSHCTHSRTVRQNFEGVQVVGQAAPCQWTSSGEAVGTRHSYLFTDKKAFVHFSQSL